MKKIQVGLFAIALIALCSAFATKSVATGGKYRVFSQESIPGGIRYWVTENPISGQIGFQYDCELAEAICTITSNINSTEMGMTDEFYIDDLSASSVITDIEEGEFQPL